MDCQTFTVKRGLVRCEHWGKCHQLGYCLCEVEPQEDGTPPPPKRKRADKLTWPARKEQVLQLARKQQTITTTALMAHTNATHNAASVWLRRLIKEGELKCQTPAIPGRYNHRPAVYTAVPHSNSAPPALPVS